MTLLSLVKFLVAVDGQQGCLFLFFLSLLDMTDENTSLLTVFCVGTSLGATSIAFDEWRLLPSPYVIPFCFLRSAAGWYSLTSSETYKGISNIV
jgi:hypothetical protein